MLVTSLPLALQARLKELRRLDEPLSTRADRRSTERDFWSVVLAEAVLHPPGSRERCEAVNRIVSRMPMIRWDGRSFHPSRRTIERKLAAHDLHGVAALGLAVRSDRGAKRVVISTRWNDALPFDPATKQDIARKLRTYIRGLTKDGAQPPF